MITRNFKGQEISLYGMGCMRLPKVGDGTDDGAIDEAAARQMVECAYQAGVNYFDTAYGYHNGNSERVIGAALAQYDRESFCLATKFPGYDAANWGKHSEIFEEQLARLQMDYVDFYLIHNVCEMNIDAYLDAEKYGDVDYFVDLRDSTDKIRHLGFSVHGSAEVMRRFLEAYGSQMEFVQIQLNYIDYEFQDARAKLQLAAQYKLPVIVMEPLRGGMLAKATPEETAAMEGQMPGASPVEWALRYLQGFSQVFTILNGASTVEQMQENLGHFAEERPLNEENLELLHDIATRRTSKGIAPCTACHYCVSHCPVGIDIPWLLELLAQRRFNGEKDFISLMALMAVEEGKRPKDCIGCGSCMAVCPQGIRIPTELAEFSELMGGRF